MIAESEDCTHNSAVFMVKKKDGTMRLVSDLRRINQLLKPFIIQLPKIDELLNEIASQRPQMLTSLDLYKGYYSVRLSPKTSNLTAFCSPQTGQSFCWRVLPMGLSVSAGAFIHVVSRLFQEKQKFSYLFYYVDDILISSSSFSEHLDHLNTMFTTFRTNSVNPTKTCVGYDELDFLGHTVSAKGVRISDSKVKAINKMTAHTNRKTLQRLLGLMQ